MSRWEKLPAAPTAEELKHAKELAAVFIKTAETNIEAAEALADKYGFGLTILEGKSWGEDAGYYYTPVYDEDSMWMPSTDEVEGSGYLDFHWASSTEGAWSREQDRNH